MIRIGVMSDTHIPRKSKRLPQELLDGIKGVDLIIHAGDINKDYVIYELEEIAPVEAVAGNTDDEYIWGMLGRRKIITVGQHKIGIIHGDGTSGSTMERVKKAFQGCDITCVVFGHSHIPLLEEYEGVLYLNPGSPTDKRRQSNFSYGIITIDSANITAQINYF
jgi:putative phosphoesterase